MNLAQGDLDAQYEVHRKYEGDLKELPPIVQKEAKDK
jgi:hypothetical protein